MHQNPYINLLFYTTGVVGIEPTLPVLETGVLPLNYTPKTLPGKLTCCRKAICKNQLIWSPYVMYVFYTLYRTFLVPIYL